MVLNEAAAAGLPLVATEAAGAAHELVEDGVNGFRVRPATCDALRDALERLADDPALRARRRARARASSSRGSRPRRGPTASPGSSRRLTARRRA